jgi:hypothetical protein
VPVVFLFWLAFLYSFVLKDNPIFLSESIVIVILGSIIVFSPPLGILVLLGKERLNTAITIFILQIFWVIIVFNDPTLTQYLYAYFVGNAMILLLPLIVLSVAPAKAVSRRLIWLALGLLLLIALNELSKFGLDLRAPQG